MKEALLTRKVSVFTGRTKPCTRSVWSSPPAGHASRAFRCGKSTFLRCLNRMNDLVPGARVEGEILLDGQDVNRPDTDVVSLRCKVGMVFQKPNPFPKTIYENVAYGLRVNGLRDESLIAEKVELSLRRAAIFDEVKDRLQAPGPGAFPAGSSSVCALPAPWLWSRRCCLWTNPPAPWTPLPPKR